MVQADTSSRESRPYPNAPTAEPVRVEILKFLFVGDSRHGATRHGWSERSVVAIDTSQRKVQHAALTRRVQGHFNYFGISGNFRSLLLFVNEAKRAWYKWLRRRSQHAHLTWEGYSELLARLPFPRPRSAVRIWGP